MALFVLFDAESGNIIARLTLSAAPPDAHNLLAISGEEYDSEPEKWAKVDLTAKKLTPK